MSESIEPCTHWKIFVWTGKVCFDNRKFQSFEDAEEFLSCRLGDKYEEERQEYYIKECEE
jgi:hypothetical protein